ncbi:hypothetical protein GCM10009540_23090 [Streptomyces turgidiscabies]
MDSTNMEIPPEEQVLGTWFADRRRLGRDPEGMLRGAPAGEQGRWAGALSGARYLLAHADEESGST